MAEERERVVSRRTARTVTLTKGQVSLREDVYEVIHSVPTPCSGNSVKRHFPRSFGDKVVDEGDAESTARHTRSRSTSRVFELATKSRSMPAAFEEKALPARCAALEGGPAAAEAKAILARMGATLHSAEAQKEAFANLLSLRSARHSRTGVCDASAVRAVVTAMRAHLADASLQQQACLTLDSFVAHDFNNQSAVGDAGGPKAIVEAMRAHAGDPHVQEWGCIALASLTVGHAANQTAAMSNGGREVIKTAFLSNPASTRLRHSAGILLRTA